MLKKILYLISMIILMSCFGINKVDAKENNVIMYNGMKREVLKETNVQGVYEVQEGDNKGELYSEMGDDFVKVKKYEINPFDKIEIDFLEKNMELGELELQGIKKFVNKCKEKGVNVYGDIEVYKADMEKNTVLKSKPNQKEDMQAEAFSVSTFATAGTRTTRTYKGYKNRKYYEVKVVYPYLNSDTKTIRKGKNFKSYSNKSFGTVLNFIISSTAKGKAGLSYNLYNLVSGLWPEVTYANSSVTHKATFFHSYTEKCTYIYEGDTLFSGSVTETGEYFFRERITIGTKEKTKDSKVSTYTTENYNKPDELAYKNYTTGGAFEGLETVKRYGKLWH